MYSFGSKSQAKLETCHSDLKLVAEGAIALSPYDFTIVHGWRGKDVQDGLYASGASQTPWPNSKHNHMVFNDPESLALDFAPWIDGKIPWGETHIFAAIAGVFFAVANDHGVPLRWGGDWDQDGNTKEHTLQDWGHIELAGDYE